VLNQVSLSWSGLSGGVDQSSDCIPLVVARKEHRLRTDLLVRQRIDLVGDLKVQEPPEDVEPGVTLQDLLPQVRRRGTVRIRWVPGMVVIAPVERKERRVLPRELRCHVHLVVGHREVHYRPRSELQQRLSLREPVILVLQYGIDNVLGEVSLQLGSTDVSGMRHGRELDRLAELGMGERKISRARQRLVDNKIDRLRGDP
jgi:hypothetical protein